MNDWELLQNYVVRGSQAAFHTLLEQYLNLVHSVALRQVQDPQLAQEVTQAVFLLLADKSAGFKPGVLLTGWLFRTTRFVAARALRAELRRKRREQEAYQMQELTAPDETWRRIQPLLDEELERLGSTERNLLLLHFYQGRNYQEAGAVLGLSEEAARKRSTRALAKLREKFTRRGAVLTATALGTLLSARAVEAAPASLSANVLRALTAKTAVTTPVQALVQQTLNAWRWAKLKTFGSVLGAGCAGVLLIALATHHSASLPTKTPVATGVPDPSPQPAMRNSIIPPAKPKKGPGQKSFALEFRLVEKETERPIPNARLAVVRWGRNYKVKPAYDLSTDAEGICHLEVEGLGRLDVGVLSPGWAARFVTWTPAKDDPIPAQYTLHTEPVTNSLGGYVRDSSGNAVAGAQVFIEFGGIGDASWRETPRERVGVMLAAPVTLTDHAGHWTCSVVPSNNPGFTLVAKDPDFADTQIVSAYTWADEESKRKTADAWAGTLLTVMGDSVGLKGHVTDEAGQAIAGARIEHAPSSDDARATRTDAHGDFVIRKLKAEDFSFAVSAEGYAPEYRVVNLREAQQPVKITLKPGATLRLKLVDQGGAAVSGAEVILEEWGEKRWALSWKAKSDADGKIEWRSAPPKEQLELCARKDGWCYTRYVHVTADGAEHTITMLPALTLSGLATDADTGSPLPQFKVVPGYGTGNGEQVLERHNTRNGSNGRFEIVFEESRQPWQLRVEAAGYEPFVSEAIPSNYTGAFQVVMKPVSESDSVRGIVLLPDGRPAPGAQLALLSLDYGVSLGDAKFDDRDAGNVTIADSSGAFAFPANRRAHSVAAVSSAGFVKLRVKSTVEPVTLRLQPWGRIEGSMSPSARARPLQDITVLDNAALNHRGGVALDPNIFRAKPDSEGRFTIEHVPPGSFQVGINRQMGTPYTCLTDVQVQPGETAQVVLGGSGRTVVGQFEWNAAGAVPWGKLGTYAMLNLKGRTNPPSAPNPANRDEAELWAVDYWESPAGREYYVGSRNYGLVIQTNGVFTIESVMPGSYEIVVIASGVSLNRDVTIPEGTVEEPFDLGSIPVARAQADNSSSRTGP